MEPRIVVHGGAWNIPKELERDHINGVEKAVSIGWDILSNGGSALEAVEASVEYMENDPTFDAGVGAFLNEEGFVELDAIIMDGKTLKAGAVAGVRNIKNPIKLAKIVLEKTEHILVVAEGALRLARKFNIPEVDPKELIVERELKRYMELKNKKFSVTDFFENKGFGTVGAVALDKNGNLAAATSTGGTPNKMVGRVGDTPLIGCGAYADNNFGAVSTTGHGESIMKVLLAKRIVDNLSRGLVANKAIKEAVDYMFERVNGRGGAIAISKNGDIGVYHNTPKMAFAYVLDGKIISGIKVP